MKYLKILGLAAIAAMAMSAVAVSSASATTLEEGGVAKDNAITLTASLDPGVSAVLSLTNGDLANTCTTSHVHGTTETPFTRTRLTGKITTLSFSTCTRPVTVHKPGALAVEHIPGTTNGTVFSEGAEVTVGTPIGTLTCTTAAAGTHIGTLTGATTVGNPSAHATMDINGTINCGFLAPSTSWKGSYIITTPTDLGVVA